jgi:hypothetical protein
LQPLISKFAQLQRDLDDARRELATQRRTKYTFASFVGASPAAVEVKRQARRAAQSSSPVLLLGETGTGKELLAHAIHAASARARGPLVSVNIAAVPDTLLEAEFFGVAPGAYTGADRKGRDGKFKLADGGTLFLDEIGDMPQALQAKLLRALQEGEIEPLGSNKLVPFRCAADCRHLARPGCDGARRQVPRGPVLPPERAAHPCAAAARAAQRHPCAGGGAGRRHGPAQRHAPAGAEPEALALLSGQAGEATSASCAMCWSRRPCAATPRTSETAVAGRGVARVRREADRPRALARAIQWAGHGRRHRRKRLRPLAVQVAEVEQRAIEAAMASHRRQQGGGGQTAGHFTRQTLRTPGKHA